MVKNLAQQGVINLSGVRPQLAKGPTKTLGGGRRVLLKEVYDPVCH
jgi:hypothetical protein